MTVLHSNSSARLRGSTPRSLGQYLVDALALGVPMYNFGSPEPLQRCIDTSGSKGTPEQVVARGKQQNDSFVSAAQFNSHSTALSGAA